MNHFCEDENVLNVHTFLASHQLYVSHVCPLGAKRKNRFR